MRYLTFLAGLGASLSCGQQLETVPLILDVEPAFGPAGSEVLLTVEGLERRSDIVPTLLGTPVPLLETSLELGTVRIRIPDDAASGRLRLTVDGVDSNPAAFFVSEVFVRPVTDEDFVGLPEGEIGAWPVNQVVAQFPERSADEVREALEGVTVQGLPLELWGFIPDLGLAQIGVSGLLEFPESTTSELVSSLRSLGADSVVRNWALELNTYWIGERDLDLLDESRAAPWRLTRIDDAWDYLTERIAGGLDLEEVTVGIQEEAVDRTHAELAAFFDSTASINPTTGGLAIWPGGRCRQDRVCSHGTQVTSVVAGLNNGAGGTGVLTGIPNDDAWVVIHGLSGARAGYRSILFEDLAAQYQLAKLGAAVVNSSHGAMRSSAEDTERSGLGLVPDAEFPTLQRYYRALFSSNPEVLFVTSAGNAGLDARESLPAAATADNHLTIAMVDAAGRPDPASNWGEVVELAAPGRDLWLPDPESGASAYAPRSGTSFAAPLVTGAAALAKAVDPTLTGAQLKKLLIATGSKLVNDRASSPSVREPAPAFTASGRMLDLRALVEAVDGRLEVDEGDIVDDGSVNGVVAGPGFGEAGGPLIFNLSLTSLNGQPIQDALMPQDFTLEALQIELVSNPESIRVDVTSATVSDLDYQIAQGDGASVAMLLDQSCSMLNNDPADLRIDAATVLIDAVLDASLEADEMSLATFPRNEGLGALLNTDVWQEFTSDRTELDADLALIRSAEGGGTPLYPSIVEYVTFVGASLEEATTTRAMVVMTDGQDGSLVPWQEARDAANLQGVPLYIVGLGSSVDFGTLQQLAVETGGTFVPARSPELLTKAFASFGAAVFGSVNLSAELALVANPGLRPNSLYRVRGRLLYDGSTGILVIPFDFELYIGNL